MPARTVQIKGTQLKNGLVNLPLSLHAALTSKDVAPQSLVISLTLPDSGSKVYVGWSGMPCQLAPPANAVSIKQPVEFIEIDWSFAEELGLKDDQNVFIDFLLKSPSATRVHVTPKTPDDWEVLELHADIVEATLLSQIRAVVQGQVFCIWVGNKLANKLMLKFVVDEVWLHGGPADSNKPARLDRDTEVIIAPKLRHRSKIQHEALAYQPASEENQALEYFSRTLFRLLPYEIDETFQSYSKHDSGREILVHPSLLSKLDTAFPSGTLTLCLYPRPKPKASTKNKRRSQEQSQGNHTVKAKKLSWRTTWSVKPGHIWISASLRQELELDVWSSYGAGYEQLQLLQNEKEQSDAQNSLLSSRARHELERTAPQSEQPQEDGKLFPSEFEQLACAESHVEACKNSVRNCLLAWQPGRRASGLLLTGASGSGKSVIARRVAREVTTDRDLLAYVQFIDCSQYADERPAALKTLFQEWVDEACWRAPSVIVLDNIERMLPAEVEHIDTFRAQLFAHLFVGIVAAAIRSRPIFVLATASHASAGHALLQTSHLLSEKHHLLAPDKVARKKLLSHFVHRKSENAALSIKQLDYTALATETEGYLPADLQDLVNQALQNSIASNQKTITLDMETFTQALAKFTPLSLRDVNLQKSTVAWSDIGGLHEVRRVLRETLEFPSKYAAIFANCPLRLRSGLLLYGYPGCGKTLLASAVAQECGLNFVNVKGPELLNKYIGSSEKSVRELFERAQSAKPCVLFFDEFDSIAPRRGHDSTGVTDRVVNQLLTQMDGAEGLDGVYVLAATSRPDLIDPALLRPGRLDKSLLCDMPSESDRLDILQACSKKLDLDADVDLAFLASRTDGFSGADLQSLIYNAHLDAVHEVLEKKRDVRTDAGEETNAVQFMSTSQNDGSLTAAAKSEFSNRLARIVKNTTVGEEPRQANLLSEESKQASKPILSEEHFERALNSARPSVPKNELARLGKIYHDFVAGRSSEGLPSGQASEEIGGRITLG